MAMNKDTLGKAIAKRIIDSNAPSDMKKKVEDLWIGIAGEIIDHIKANAQITVAAGIPVSTAGSPTAQTGATTSTGTGTITG